MQANRDRGRQPEAPDRGAGPAWQAPGSPRANSRLPRRSRQRIERVLTRMRMHVFVSSRKGERSRRKGKASQVHRRSEGGGPVSIDNAGNGNEYRPPCAGTPPDRYCSSGRRACPAVRWDNASENRCGGRHESGDSPGISISPGDVPVHVAREINFKRHACSLP